MGEFDLTGKEMELRFAVKNRKWKRVVQIYDDPEIRKSRINRWGDTALYAAIETEDTATVERLIGDTPLHCAASRGSACICAAIIGMFHKSLIGVRNNSEETPLFLAAFHDHRVAFLVLHLAAGEDSPLYWRRNNGDSMPHCTIRREYFGTYTSELTSYLSNKGY
ncbi:uncharacterized protein LOC114737272 [Neltuma alba]|uniref:uncharacterized protein LOC114737272 n=1 Tax=Neltuma alba TaxID=207710 RepID=UPI0010A592D4|nr:uncharacterized protein LOC114737272 [Prosopis alba]